jgi:hypothetical protein
MHAWRGARLQHVAPSPAATSDEDSAAKAHDVMAIKCRWDAGPSRVQPPAISVCVHLPPPLSPPTTTHPTTQVSPPPTPPTHPGALAQWSTSRWRFTQTCCRSWRAWPRCGVLISGARPSGAFTTAGPKDGQEQEQGQEQARPSLCPGCGNRSFTGNPSSTHAPAAPTNNTSSSRTYRALHVPKDEIVKLLRDESKRKPRPPVLRRSAGTSSPRARAPRRRRAAAPRARSGGRKRGDTTSESEPHGMEEGSSDEAERSGRGRKRERRRASAACGAGTGGANATKAARHGASASAGPTGAEAIARGQQAGAVAGMGGGLGAGSPLLGALISSEVGRRGGRQGWRAGGRTKGSRSTPWEAA